MCSIFSMVFSSIIFSASSAKRHLRYIRECINKPDPRRKLRRLNIVKGREGAKGNKSFTLRKHKHEGRLSHRLFQAVLREQAVQIVCPLLYCTKTAAEQIVCFCSHLCLFYCSEEPAWFHSQSEKHTSAPSVSCTVKTQRAPQAPCLSIRLSCHKRSVVPW